MGLRIAVLSRNFAATGGGAERYAIALVEHLAARHEVHVFAQTVAHDYPGVTYHQVPMPLRRPRWINQLYFAWATWRATRSGFDIVHSHENTWHGNVQTVHVLPIKHTLFAGRSGLRLLARWLKVLASPRLLAYLWLERARYRLDTKRSVVLSSQALRDVMVQSYPHAQRALCVIPPGVEQAPGRCTQPLRQAARAELGLPVEGTCLLFVGNDFEKKGLRTLLQALVLLPADVRLAVVGQSEQMDTMCALAHALGVAARVVFLGARQDMVRAYAAADMLVHPTLEDTYAMVVLEAMAQGLPVVVSGPAQCGIAADLTHGDNAWLLDDPQSATEIAAAVQRVLDDGALAEALSTQATRFAQAHSWTEAAARQEQVYTELLRKKPRWLVLSHAFNMDGRAASQTITDKLPHLERAGIELVVLSGVSGSPDTHYEHHQLWPAGPAGIRFELRHVLRKRLGSGLRYRLAMLPLSLLLLPGMFIEKLLRPVESSWSWWFSAYCRSRALARRQPFDLIYSTGGAFAAHVAARHLKHALNAPWLAEVHDPLVMPGRAEPEGAQEAMQAEVERLICEEADVAIWFTEQALASARARHPQLGARGKIMLPGIDAPALTMPPYLPSAKFIIGHFGSLSATRNLEPVIAALELLRERRPELVVDMELEVYGGPLDAVSQARLTTSPVRDRVRHFGRIEADPVTGLSGRTRILHRMRTVDVLLLLHGVEPICAEYIPSKLYEYLWMQRPILALVHRNPQMAEMLRGQGHSVVAAGDVAGLLRELEDLFNRWRSHGLPDSGQYSPYTTQAAVQQILAWAQAL